MAECLHLLIPSDHTWHHHCGLPEGAVPAGHSVPLAFFAQYRDRLCPGCQRWPHPATTAPRPTPGPQKKRQARTSRTPTGETILHTGLSHLIGGRGQHMNQLEFSYYAVLNADPTVLKVWFEPCALLLPGKVHYWPDFRCVMWDGSMRWIECKARKKTGTARIVPLFRDDAKIKWKQAVERYTKTDERFLLAIGWREQGRYCWDVREETV